MAVWEDVVTVGLVGTDRLVGHLRLVRLDGALVGHVVSLDVCHLTQSFKSFSTNSPKK